MLCKTCGSDKFAVRKVYRGEKYNEPEKDYRIVECLSCHKVYRTITVIECSIKINLDTKPIFPEPIAKDL